MARIAASNLDKLAAHKYRWARVLQVHSDWDTVDIELLDAQEQPTGEQWQDVPLFYHCKPDSALRSNGALEGAAAAFAEGDEVIVELDGFQNVRRVVARKDGLKRCTVLFPLLATEEMVENQCLSDPRTSTTKIGVRWVDSKKEWAWELVKKEYIEDLTIEIDEGDFYIDSFQVNGVEMDEHAWSYADHIELTGVPQEISVRRSQPSGGQQLPPMRLRVSGSFRRQDYEYRTYPAQLCQVNASWDEGPVAGDTGWCCASEFLCTDWRVRIYHRHTFSKGGGADWLLYVHSQDYYSNARPAARKEQNWRYGVLYDYDSAGLACGMGCNSDGQHTMMVWRPGGESYRCSMCPWITILRSLGNSVDSYYVRLESSYSRNEYEEASTQCGVLPCDAYCYDDTWDYWPPPPSGWTDDPLAFDEVRVYFAPQNAGQDSIGYWIEHFQLFVPSVESRLFFTELPDDLKNGGFS